MENRKNESDKTPYQRLHIQTIIRRKRLTAIGLYIYLMRVKVEHTRNRNIWRRGWLYDHDSQGVCASLVKELQLQDTESYFNFFRMSPENFHYITDRVRPLIQRQDTNFHKAVPVDERVAVTLRFLATGESYKNLSYSFRLGATTIASIVPETCRAIHCTLKDEYLKMPETEEEWLKISEEFQKKWNFPNVLGAIDGKHIALMAPPKSGSLFYNYKHFFSIVLMALVDANYKFIYVDVGCNGRISDGGVFAGCTLVEALNKRLANIPKIAPLPNTNELVSFHILGDEAFPLREDLLKPFPFRNMSTKQRIFNYRLSRARRVVENAFGILCSRFRVFLNRIALSPEKVELLVMASCALHNFLKESKGNLGSAETVNCETESTSLQSAGLPYSNNSTIVSKEKRNRLMEYFSTPSGSVEWQESMI